MEGMNMDGSFGQDVNHNIIKLLQNREQNQHTARALQQCTHFTDNLIKRLSLENELEGHQGCVNCIEWTADGRHLASGSDDTNVILWDPFSHKKLKTINTPHIGNIFSVKFLGLSGSMLATGAGDCRVIVQDLQQENSTVPLLDCSCHRGRVKRLATAPDQPLVFWSSSEDGLLIQYDMREPHICSSNCSVFVDLAPRTELKCIAVNPTKPHYIAVGANDCYVRLYDRRSVNMRPYRYHHHEFTEQLVDSNCVQYFTPGHLAKLGSDRYKLAVTYVSFNARGSELLANMGGDQIYLFDVNNPRYSSELWVPHGAEDIPSYNRIMLRPQPPSPPECESVSPTSAVIGITGSQNAPFGHKKNNGRNHNILDEVIIGKVPKKNVEREQNSKTASQPYLTKASHLMRRKWIGDIYSAAREYLHVVRSWPGLADGYLGLVDCLVKLKWKSEAVDWLNYFLRVHPGYAGDHLVEAQRKEILRITRDRADSREEPGSEAASECEARLREKSADFAARYLGHCNTTTDIKEANFMGENGQYVLAGSDDGIIFIWDRHTTNIVTALWGDVSIVNCVQPHPNACLIATSGIDPVVKLWSPSSEDGSENLRQVKNLDAAVEANQRRMAMDPFETMLANMGYRLRESAIETSLNEIPTCRTS